ncbi:MAG: hypothetical protein ACYDA5_11470 [Vulcanimicrobiaceae bacterium]
MNLAAIDSYLLHGSPEKVEVIAELLAWSAPPPEARPFLEGMRVLGARTPDLAICALRLALSGRSPSDEAVGRLRDLSEAARAGGASAAAAQRAFAAEVAGW